MFRDEADRQVQDGGRGVDVGEPAGGVGPWGWTACGGIGAAAVARPTRGEPRPHPGTRRRDLAHAPEAVSDHYPGVDQVRLRECRMLVLAMVTTWRWDRGDEFPDGRRLGAEWLRQLRAARG